MSRTPRLPGSREWIRLGVHLEGELHAGEQSRVFAAIVDDRKAVVKLIERRLVDSTFLVERMRVAELLAADLDSVVAPMRIDGDLVQQVDEWLVTATPFVDGGQADITDASDAQLMGRTLARLHDALDRLPAFRLPPVAALDVVETDREQSGWQLLHGDFSNQNTIATPTGLRVFDFDECGYGPVAFDLANSLYMVLFDAEVNGRPEQYEVFRPAFLDGYAEASGTDVARSDVDALIDLRIHALSRWLDDLTNAPIGIRTSAPEWRETLKAFVRAHDGTARADDR